jgi:hypothetical protein
MITNTLEDWERPALRFVVLLEYDGSLTGYTTEDLIEGSLDNCEYIRDLNDETEYWERM